MWDGQGGRSFARVNLVLMRCSEGRHDFWSVPVAAHFAMIFAWCSTSWERRLARKLASGALGALGSGTEATLGSGTMVDFFSSFAATTLALLLVPSAFDGDTDDFLAAS